MLNPFVKSGDPHQLIVGMAGVKMGDRLVQIGCELGGRLGAVAAKVGLSGRAVAIVPDQRSAERARKGAADAGVLVEVDMAPPHALAADDQAFDLAIVDDTGGLVGGRATSERTAVIREIIRVLRPGGRLLYVGAAPRRGVAGLFGRPAAGALFAGSAEALDALKAGGFRSIRTLAEREGLVFLEGIKPR